MRCNEGQMDRSIRIQLGGAAALVTGLAWAAGVNLVWLGGIAGILMLTAIGFCPLYPLLGIDTTD